MKIGFIGCGNMASAIIGGLIKNGTAPAEITASDALEAAREKAKESFGINVTADNKYVCENSDVLVIAVKPQYLSAALDGMSESIASDTLVISIVAGKTLEALEAFVGSGKKVVRVMPNTPALVGCGMSGFCANANVLEADKAIAKTILESFGEAEEVPESMMDAVTAVSGSSPAFVFMFIEALADGAVLDGMPRDKALHFAAQTVLGSAKLALETGKHPGALKDMVCSPGGTTIEGVRVLEDAGFRGTVIEAVDAACQKSKLL